MDGDVLDVCSIAMHSALKCTLLPKVDLLIGESGTPEEFEVSGDICDAVSLPFKSLPVCISIYKVSP